MITPNNVHSTLKNYILTDGFNHVVDLMRSHDSWFVDARTGKSYLDCYSMHAAQPLGWRHHKVIARSHEVNYLAIHNPSNSDCYSVPQTEFVEKFASITNDFKHYFFVAGGTLAVENALKAAFDWKAQQLGLTDEQANNLDVIHFTMAFHGRSGYTLSLTNTGESKTKWFPKWDWTRVDSPAIDLYGDSVAAIEDAAIEKINQALDRRLVAAIILEPIQSEGGDNHFRSVFLTRLRQLANDHNVMLIFDEVQTGVGMTGKMWCYQNYGVVPDMMCFGKKTQVCGFCATDRIDSVPDNVFKVSSRINSTWGGNLVDMARSKLYMEIIEEDKLVDNAKEVGDYFLGKLQELGLNNARGKGLLLAFDLENTEARDAMFNSLSEDILCLKCGPKSIRFRPHLTFSKEDVDKAISFIKANLG